MNVMEDNQMNDVETLTPSQIAKTDVRINKLEEELGKLPCPHMPVINTFTPGLYSREIFMPAGTLLTSKIHKTEHQYVVLSGKVSVWIPDVGTQYIEAPYVGITRAGTRRVLYIHEDTRWITFHPTEETDLEKIEEAIIEPHDFPKQVPQEELDKMIGDDKWHG